jgi:pyruvate carboxylase subunit B
VDGKEYKIEAGAFKSRSSSTRKEATVKLKAEAHEGSVIAVMPGAIIKILMKEGDKVEPETVLLIVEAMKMENEILAERKGTVKKIHVRVGDKVEPGQPLVDIE